MIPDEEPPVDNASLSDSIGRRLAAIKIISSAIETNPGDYRSDGLRQAALEISAEVNAIWTALGFTKEQRDAAEEVAAEGDGEGDPAPLLAPSDSKGG